MLSANRSLRAMNLSQEIAHEEKDPDRLSFLWDKKKHLPPLPSLQLVTIIQSIFIYTTIIILNAQHFTINNYSF